MVDTFIQRDFSGGISDEDFVPNSAITINNLILDEDGELVTGPVFENLSEVSYTEDRNYRNLIFFQDYILAESSDTNDRNIYTLKPGDTSWQPLLGIIPDPDGNPDVGDVKPQFTSKLNSIEYNGHLILAFETRFQSETALPLLIFRDPLIDDLSIYQGLRVEPTSTAGFFSLYNLVAAIGTATLSATYTWVKIVEYKYTASVDGVSREFFDRIESDIGFFKAAPSLDQFDYNSVPENLRDRDIKKITIRYRASAAFRRFAPQDTRFTEYVYRTKKTDPRLFYETTIEGELSASQKWDAEIGRSDGNDDGRVTPDAIDLPRVRNEPIPPCKFVATRNSVVAVASDRTVQFSKPNLGLRSFPSSFRIEVPTEITGLFSAIDYFIVFTKDGTVFRIDGLLNELGFGNLSLKEIASGYGDSYPNTYVSFENNIYFLTNAGFVISNGFDSTLISDHITRDLGDRDSASVAFSTEDNAIYWAFGQTVYVLYTKRRNSRYGVFTTFTLPLGSGELFNYKEKACFKRSGDILFIRLEQRNENVALLEGELSTHALDFNINNPKYFLGADFDLSADAFLSTDSDGPTNTQIPTMVIDVGEKSAQFEFRNRIRSTSNIKVPSQLRRGERIRFTIKGYRFRARAFSVRYRNLRYPTQGLRIDNNNS